MAARSSLSAPNARHRSDQTEAERCGMPYVNQRWLGGTLTNWVTIQQGIVELTREKCSRPVKFIA